MRSLQWQYAGTRELAEEVARQPLTEVLRAASEFHYREPDENGGWMWARHHVNRLRRLCLLELRNRNTAIRLQSMLDR